MFRSIFLRTDALPRRIPGRRSEGATRPGALAGPDRGRSPLLQVSAGPDPAGVGAG